MQKLIFSLVIIVAGLFLGYIGQTLARNTDFIHENSILFLRKFLQKLGLLFFMPVSFVAAVWVVSFEDIRVAFLPLIGAGTLLLGGGLGLVAASVTKNGEKQKAEFFCCGSFTNLGSIGALVAFLFLGEVGLGLVAFYKLFEETVYYTICLPIIRYISGGKNDETFLKRIIGISKDPFVRMAVAALACGLFLNVSGITRPLFFENIIAFFVPVGTFIILVSIGLGMRFSSANDYLVEGLVVSLVKFIAVPLISVTIAYLFGFGSINDGLPLKVVLIASSMPIAFAALVVASVYDLDLDLANSCWLITTGALVIVIPWLYFLLTFM